MDRLAETIEEAKKRLQTWEMARSPLPDSPRAVRVEPLTEGRLLVLFEGGEVRLFDVAPYFDKGIFARLRDEACFSEAFIDLLGGIEWPCGPAFSRDTLYLKSQTA